MQFSRFFRNSSLDIPACIGFKIEIVIVLLLFLIPLFGQTYPELIATGWHEIFNSS